MDQKIKPIKKLGQNFLIDKNILKKIIKTADLKPQDIVLEIGPGLGALTKELAKKAKKVIAVEKDSRMCQALKENLKDFNNIEIINQDILKFGIFWIGLANPKKDWLSQSRQSRSQSRINPSKKRYKLIANLPFYITAPVIRKFLESENPPQEMVLMIQKEVAQRICAQPPKMSILAVSVQFYAEAKIISYVSKKSFCPRPKVDAAIIKITPWDRPGLSKNKDRFFRTVKAGFSQPRKQLINNLSGGLKLDKEQINKLLKKLDIQPEQRAETLSLNNWLDLSKML
jgi:16S rRNA (adenine1518-N6/adenine1519-N6)-dimethyltransferase